MHPVTTAAGHGLFKGVHGQRVRHPVGHGVAHDPSGVHVLDRAEVERALAGGVLGEVCQPEPVRRGRGELALDTVIVHGRVWLAPAFAASGPDRAMPSVLPAQPPGGSGGHGLPGRLGFVSQQPVPEFRICLVGGVQGVGPVSGFQFSLANRILEPAVVGLAGELEDPQGHRDEDTVSGEPKLERGHHFFGTFAWDR